MCDIMLYMNETLMTNIFFAITALSTVTFTIVLVVLLVYVIKLVKKIRQLTDIVVDEAEKISHDIDDARTVVRNVAVAKIIAVISEKIFGKK